MRTYLGKYEVQNVLSRYVQSKVARTAVLLHVCRDNPPATTRGVGTPKTETGLTSLKSCRGMAAEYVVAYHACVGSEMIKLTSTHTEKVVVQRRWREETSDALQHDITPERYTPHLIPPHHHCFGLLIRVANLLTHGMVRIGFLVTSDFQPLPLAHLLCQGLLKQVPRGETLDAACSLQPAGFTEYTKREAWPLPMMKGISIMEVDYFLIEPASKPPA